MVKSMHRELDSLMLSPVSISFACYGERKASSPRARNGLRTTSGTPRREVSGRAASMRGWFVPGL